MTVAQIDLADIQGDVLRAYGNAYVCTSYVFIRIGHGGDGRAWLRGLVDRVTTAAPWMEGKPATTLNVAVTAAGLASLGLVPQVIKTFSAEFRVGMAARAGLLGDTLASDPDDWEDGLDDAGARHVLLTVNALTDAHLEVALAELRAGVEAAGDVEIVYEQHARLLDGVREHFGFADGFAHPALEGSTEEAARGGGVPERHDGWRPLALGEFVLGYEDEDSRD